MTIRSRERTQACPVEGMGTRVILGTTYTYPPGPLVGRRDLCEDEVDGTRSAKPLKITHSRVEPEPLNGSVIIDSANYRTYEKLRPEWATTTEAVGATLPALPSLNSLALKAINNGNPSRASVDLGVGLAELREAPQLLIRGAGSLLHNGADAFLAYQFGWRPLVNDVMDLFEITDHVEHRVREIQALNRKGGLRRKVRLKSDTRQTGYSNTTLHSSMGDLFQGRSRSTSTRRVWGTTRWIPSPEPFHPFVDRDPVHAARRAVYGAHFDATTAWNLLPWSWMLDWFGNLGDVIQTTRNTVGGQRTGPVCIMIHTKHRENLYRTGGPKTVTGGGGYVETETKERRIVESIYPEFGIPFLGANRLSILGALSVSQVPRHRLPTLEQAFDLLRRGPTGSGRR